MGPESGLWKCPSKTTAKLEILRAYVGAWFSILASRGFKHVFYIDGFCGPGEYLDGEEGSPIIATRIANSTAQKYPGFSATLFFVDTDSTALSHLQSNDAIRNHHSRIDINIRHGAFSDEADEIVRQISTKPNSPVFSFVDPFGFSQSPFAKVQELMRNRSSEVVVNLMCGFMNRFKEHKDEQVTAQISRMVGEDDLSEIVTAEDSIATICDVYERNLKSIGSYTLKFMMRDEKNIRDNAIFFCGKHPRGFEKIKEAMWKVDPIHGNSFSAHADHESFQSDFFESQPQTHRLSDLLLTHYAGQKRVPVSELFRWVKEETDTFLPKHARIELEDLLSKGVITEVVDPDKPGRKRRKNTWPERLLVSFR